VKVEMKRGIRWERDTGRGKGDMGVARERPIVEHEGTLSGPCVAPGYNECSIKRVLLSSKSPPRLRFVSLLGRILYAPWVR
jgi:hypothetical protein